MASDDKMPNFSQEMLNYEEKFKTFLGIEESSGNFAIGEYEISDDVPETKEYFADLIRKSLADNHDYLLDYAKERGVKIVYKPGCVY